MKRSLKIDSLNRIGLNQPVVSAANERHRLSSGIPSSSNSTVSSEVSKKMGSPLPDPDYPEFDDVAYGSIPRAHLSAQRPPLPLPDRSPRNSSGSPPADNNHYYASAGTIKREVNALRAGGTSGDYYSAPYSVGNEIPAKRPAPPPPGGPYSHQGLPPPPSSYLSYANNPEYVSRVSSYIKETGRKHASRRDLEGLVAAIGLIGVILSIASLVAYFAVQAPHLRSAIGPAYDHYLHEDSNSTLFIGTSNVQNENGRTLQSAEVSKTLQTANVIYGVELAACITLGLLLLLSDALLIHGVRKKSAAFLIPWLIMRGVLLALLIAAFVLILKFVKPDAFKSFCIIPAVAGVLVLLCWMKVLKLYKLTRRQFKPPKVKNPYSDYSHYSPEMTRESPYASSKPKKSQDSNYY